MFLRQAASRFLRRRFRLQFSELSSPKNCQKNSFETIWKDRKWSFDGNHGLWLFLSANAAIYIGINANPVLAKEISLEQNIENDSEGSNVIGLQKLEDGTVVSNIHIMKWRVFTLQARDFSHQEKSKDAEGLLISALQEAREGFGAKDPHVAFACNNLARRYVANIEYDKALPLYLEAVNILEEAYGPNDVGVAAALQSLGQCYRFQRRLEKARESYERALKIKRRVLGLKHLDCAETMYDLALVLYRQGKRIKAETLILDSIRILEEGGLADSFEILARLRELEMMYTRAGRLEDATNTQRKILHIYELTKGWNSLETVKMAERLTRNLISTKNFKEAEELLQRCLHTRKSLLPEDYSQISMNTYVLAMLAMRKIKGLKEIDTSKALAELNKAKNLYNDTIRIGHKILNKLMIQTGNMQSDVALKRAEISGSEALFFVLISYSALAMLEIEKRELEESTDEESSALEIENALLGCVSSYKKYGTETSISDIRRMKKLYIGCLEVLLKCTTTKRIPVFDLHYFARLRFFKLTENS